MRVLAIDIGGTKSALALCSLIDKSALGIEALETFDSRDFQSLEDMVRRWKSLYPQKKFDAVGAGVAGPVINGNVHLTNLGWNINSTDVSKSVGTPFKVCNDLTAHAWGILSLPSSSLKILNTGSRRSGPKALIAAGTGLGESIISFHDNTYRPLGGEGGHSSFSPCTERELRLLSYLRNKHPGHVSWERILGGSEGFRNLAEFLVHDTKRQFPSYLLEQKKDWGLSITEAAHHGDTFATELLQFYAELYGREAGNLALKCLPFGGLYIGGGIAPKLLPWIETHFMNGYLDKGRFADILREIPVSIVLDSLTGLKGAALQFGLEQQI